jgi:hypothetical protein
MKTEHPKRSILLALGILLALAVALDIFVSQANAGRDPATAAEREHRRTPTPTLTRTRTPTSTSTRRPTVTSTPRGSPTRTPTRNSTPRSSPTRTPTRTSTPLGSATATPTPGTATPTNTAVRTPTRTSTPPPGGGNYVLIGWNDLGMHCYNPDFSNVALLPPYNNLYVQVIKRGDPPQIITTGVSVSYSFPDNTYSVGKTNFWTYVSQLYGVNLAPNVGLTGKGLSGSMDPSGDHFVAQGIPLTEYSDSAPTTRQPYQLANIVAKDSAGNVIATNQVVAPVSTEMHCDNCHFDGAFGISTGNVFVNVLALHDQLSGSQYPAGHTTPLVQRQPVNCAECHSDNALGAPGLAGVQSLSNAMHTMHTGKVPDTLTGCYNCHPGPTTKCLRDIMFNDEGVTCINCHGGMAKVASNANPWLNEPRCDSCHGVKQNAALYRQSTGHGGLFCEACHDSTHAIAPSSQPNDAIKFNNLQGSGGPLRVCTVCHLTQPSGSIH